MDQKHSDSSYREDGEDEEYSASVGNLMESRASLLDDLLNQRLADAFHKETSQVLLHEVAKIANQYDPIDLAYAVTRLPPLARVVVYENLPDLQAKVIFMINTGSNTRAAIFRQIDDQQIKRLIDQMPPDEAVWVLDDLSDRRLKRILELLEPKKSLRIRELQQHDRHSAGRMMANEFFAFHMNVLIGEVAAQIRVNPGIELTSTIFVLNDAGELIGYVPDRNLIINPHYIPLRLVMRPILHKVTAETSRDEVVDIVERYKISALPVVDDFDHIIGVITYESVVEAMEDIADETIASIAGTAEHVGAHEPIVKRFLSRTPWLFVTLCAGLFTATTISHLSGYMWFGLILPFVQLITGMSGNVGIQCSTVLVRGMSTGELSSGSRREVIRKELGIGLLIGSFFGLSCGVLVYFLMQAGLYHIDTDPFLLSATVSCGVWGACLTATVLGTFSPFFFAYLRIDPAIASGPIVTAFNDVLSTLMFFLIASAVHALFGLASIFSSNAQ